MTTGNILHENLVDQAIASLRDLLGDGWEITNLASRGLSLDPDSAFDARLEIKPPDQGRYTEVLISAHRMVTPRTVEQRIAPIRNILAHIANPPVMLVVAPWISQIAQKELRGRGIGYLDLTGNTSVSISVPSIRLETHGAMKAPSSLGDGGPKSVTLAGPRAGRIVRFLVDFAPPYRAVEIAAATGVSLPWVSRLLKQLEDQLLVRREGRTIDFVNWQGLLRARAETFDLLRHNPYVGMIAPRGIRSVLDALVTFSRFDDDGLRIAVTGPYAARAVAPLTFGGQLMLYTDAGPRTADMWGDELGLLRANEGADVLLLRAHDKVVFRRTRQVDGVPHVALSQLVLDGLAGPGRMPAEAEAVLKHMEDNIIAWRVPWRGEPDLSL